MALTFPVLLGVDVNAVAADRSDRGEDYRLRAKAQAEPGGERRAEAGQAEHQEVERARQQLGDDQHQADDRPGQQMLHGRLIY